MVTKRKTVLEKFRTFFKGLNLYDRSIIWFLLTALRSCDMDDTDRVKYLTTCRLRTAIFGPELGDRDYLSGCGAMTRREELTAEEIVEAEKLLSETPYHFKHHLLDAIGYLKEMNCEHIPDLIALYEKFRS